MRVIAGSLGKRRLVAPRGMTTRPTSDRVREALFSVLGHVGGARVLDLYAGTGALAIEALSRGAARAVLVESARAAVAALRENVEALGLLARSHVIAQPVQRALAEIARKGPYDLIFADPPYADAGEALALVAALAKRGCLAPGARVVVEHAARDALPTAGPLHLVDTRRYGDTALSFYETSGPEDESGGPAEDESGGPADDDEDGPGDEVPA